MKIILLRSKGKARTLGVNWAAVGLTLSLAVGAVGYAGWYVGSQKQAVADEVVQKWRQKLKDQEALVVELADKNRAQNQAVGRQLATMQARLLRMEALGTHMTAVADLSGEEFDFTKPPAQGGPMDPNEVAIEWDQMGAELDRLSMQLKRRETELTILGQVLANEDIKEESQLGGRPVKWGWLSSPYGNRVDPFTGKTAWHNGVDFAGKEGSVVIAVASGVVTYAGERSGFGKMVEISHPNGYTTRYAHQKTVSVNAGDVVKKGETLGTMGSTGRSTGPHVHLEVLKNGRSVNPAKILGS